MEPSPDYDEFVRSRTPALLRLAYVLTGDQHLAEDLVQSALARTHRAWARLRDVGNAEAYTRKVMYHLQVSWWRRRRVPESVSAEVPEPAMVGGVADPGEQVAVRATLRQALLRLTPSQRAVLVLRFFEDRSESETAQALGVTVGTVKSQTSRALERMRTMVPELAAVAFTAVADEVRVVDVRDRSLRTSERIKRLQRTGVVVGVILAVAAVTGGVLVTLPGAGGPAPVPGQSGSPSPGASPSASPSPRPSVDPTPPFRSDGTPRLGSTTLLYLEHIFQGETVRVQVQRLDGDGLRTLSTWQFPQAENCAWRSMTISPDGTTLAYATGDGAIQGNLGDLYVMDVNGGTPRLLTSNVSCSGGDHPMWFPDSASLRIHRGSQAECERVTVATGVVTATTGWCGYVAFSPGGAFRARNGYVETAAGEIVRPLPPDTGLTGETPVPLSISADGRYVGLGARNTDPGISADPFALADTVTGEVELVRSLFGLPDSFGASVQFGPAGQVVASIFGVDSGSTWLLLRQDDLSPDGVLDSVPATTGLASGQFVILS